MTRLPLLLMLLWLPLACSPETPPATDPTATYDVYGEAFAPEGAVPVQALPAATSGGTIQVEGRVAQVCQANGCWLTLQADGAAPIRIDVARDDAGAYRFTVPTDISGRRVIVRGTLAVNTAMHHDDEAMHHDASVQITASGVLVEKVR